MTGLPCVVCGGTKQYLGSTPNRPVSAPLILLPCPKCKNAHVGGTIPAGDRQGGGKSTTL